MQIDSDGFYAPSRLPIGEKSIFGEATTRKKIISDILSASQIINVQPLVNERGLD